MPQRDTKSEILSVSLPRTLAEGAKKAAQQAGVSRSKLVQQALQQYLWLEEWQELQTYGFEQALKLGLQPDDVQRLIDEYRKENANHSDRR